MRGASGTGWLFLLLASCGPAIPGPAGAPAGPQNDAGVPAPADGDPAADAVPDEAGAVPPPPSPDADLAPPEPLPIPPGFEPLALPEGAGLAGAWWNLEGVLPADRAGPVLAAALPAMAACLVGGSDPPPAERTDGTAPAAPARVPVGSRLPFHLVVAPNGHVVEIGGPLAADVDPAAAAAVTCAQAALRPLRFPAADGDTRIRIFLER